LTIILGKANLGRPWRVPQCSRMLRLEEFRKYRHMKLARLSAARTDRLYSPEYSLVTYSC